MLPIANKKAPGFEPSRYDVYVGRPGPWGNPFSHLDNAVAEVKVADRNESVEAFRQTVNAVLNGHTTVKIVLPSRSFVYTPRLTQSDLLTLCLEVQKHGGRARLVCWCAPEKCHAEVLAKMYEMWNAGAFALDMGDGYKCSKGRPT